jgi:hypothetical protein
MLGRSKKQKSQEDESKSQHSRRRRGSSNVNPQAIFRRFVRMLEKLQGQSLPSDNGAGRH